jgi:uncharacterized peroxidase-related enzyme
MSIFSMHTLETVPEGSKEQAEHTAERFGFLPNLMAVMAESPGVMEGYETLHKLLMTKTLFTPAEVQLLALTISRRNGCTYCMSAHSWRAAQSKGMKPVIEAIRSDEPIPDPKMAALADFANLMLDKQGWVTEEEIEPFLAVGFERRQVMEVVLAIAWKTLSNYINHMAETPVDDKFKDNLWDNPNAA